MKKNNSRKYAKALFQLATETNQVKEIGDAFEKIKLLYEKETINFFINPFIDEETKFDVIKSSFDSLPKILLNLLFILIERRELRILPDIESKYIIETLDSQNTISAEVISSIKLEIQILDKIKNRVAKITNKNILIKESIDKSILGGLIIKAGDLVIDGSVRGK